MTFPSEIRSISLIGAGNVAWHLGKGLKRKGYLIREVYSRNEDSAQKLANELGCFHTSSLLNLRQDTDLFILAVTDSAISSVVKELKLKNQIVVHTAGSINMEALASLSSEYGILYPLQTFSKDIPLDLTRVPIFIEASGQTTLRLLEKLASDLSDIVRFADSRQRMMLHVAAVFASNYTNLMFTMASDILRKEGLNFDDLKPLITETSRKACLGDPAIAQTGPAKRNDLEVIQKHIDLLASQPEYAELYRLLAEKIISRFNA